MKKMVRKCFLAGILLGVIGLTSCSNDEDIDLFPEGTASLRMMNEDNGHTLLGNSDVYITKEGNFVSSQYPLFDMGRREGIGDIGMPDFVNMAPSVAVEPGHGYVICNAGDVFSFSDSRTYAIAENAHVYRVYVDTWIRDKEDNITGANVRFLLGKPLEDGMPAWGSVAGTVYMAVTNRGDEYIPVKIKLPSDDIEVSYLDGGGRNLTHTLSGHTVTFALKEDFYFPGSDGTEYKVRIRSGNIYTEVTLRAEVRYE